MVQLMNNGEPEKKKAVKMEVEDSLEEEHAPLHKRPKVFFLFFRLHTYICVDFMFLI